MVLGASFDKVEDNRAFAEKYAFEYPLLTVTREVGMKFGAADAPDQKTAKRVAYVIGADGRVSHVWPKADTATFASDVLATL